MFLPYSDNNPTHRTPWVNSTLIALNVMAFVLFNFRPDATEFVLAHAFHPTDVTVTGVFSSMFLHAGLLHLFGNMLFLHIYGDNVEDKMGHLGYLLFYFSAGTVAAFFHAATSTMPAVGASGAIAGVMGAYVIVFPKAKVKFFCFFWPFFVRSIELYSWFALGIWFLGQLMDHASSGDQAGVAFAAHIGGFILGSIVTGLLVLGNVLKVGPERPNRPSRTRPAPTPTTPAPVDLGERWEQEKSRGVPCPACIKAMPNSHIDGFKIEHCYDCGGIWLDAGETETLLRREHLPYSLLNPPARAPEGVLVPHGQRQCPRCETALVDANIEGVDAEGCSRCKGLWLERGELGELRERLS